MIRTKKVIAIFFKSQNKNLQGKVKFRRLPCHCITVATIFFWLLFICYVLFLMLLSYINNANIWTNSNRVKLSVRLSSKRLIILTCFFKFLYKHYYKCSVVNHYEWSLLKLLLNNLLKISLHYKYYRVPKREDLYLALEWGKHEIKYCLHCLLAM